MKSVMQHMFSQIPQVQMQRSVFDRSHGHKTTFNEGQLIPVYVDEALPGDTFTMSASIFARLATPIFPIMDNMYLDIHFFAVPCRILWEHWVNFMGERENPSDSTVYTVPVIHSAGGSGGYGYLQGSLYDYLGVPLRTSSGYDLPISALFPRAYNKIYRDWYRDQNLIEFEPTIITDDGPDDAGNYGILNRAKTHDYFTSALPWPQKGAAVTMPLGNTAPVIGNGIGIGLTDQSYQFGLVGTELNIATTGMAASTAAYGSNVGDTSPTAPTALNAAIGITSDHAASGMIADLSMATAPTINAIRQAFAWQRILEKDARGGTRYTEIILNHFRVKSEDGRQQRAEYLGGGTTPISIHPVQQTSGTHIDGQSTPQGNLAAFGVCNSQGNGFSKSFTEHCIIMGIVSVRYDLTYQYGLPRMFSRKTRFDFYWPSLANLGEQEIYNKEIYATESDNTDNDIFGYQERFAEYRYYPSKVTSLFRSNGVDPLDSWHLAEANTSLPTLSQSFIEYRNDPPGGPYTSPVSRAVAIPSQPHFIFDSHFTLHCARPMPTYSVPGLIDHF